MKVPPALNLNPDMNRIPGMNLPFSPDMLWRYPAALSSLQQQASSLAPPSSPLNDVKNQMPTHLGKSSYSFTFLHDINTVKNVSLRLLKSPVVIGLSTFLPSSFPLLRRAATTSQAAVSCFSIFNPVGRIHCPALSLSLSFY